jgi:ribosome maturation factor RimP
LYRLFKKWTFVRGVVAPLFIAQFMITQAQILSIVEDKIADTEYFIVDVNVRPGNKIEVFVDSEGGVTIEGCTDIHRHIEKQFDREVEDFDLQVSSPGVGQPLKVLRQYFKNVGRNVQVKTKDGQKVEGLLKAANDTEMTLQVRVKEEVEGKKGKKWVEKEINLAYPDTIETKVVISFK